MAILAPWPPSVKGNERCVSQATLPCGENWLRWVGFSLCYLLLPWNSLYICIDWLIFNKLPSTCLCIPSTGIKDVHYTQPEKRFETWLTISSNQGSNQCHGGTTRNGFPVWNSSRLGSHTGPPVSLICAWQPLTMKSLEYGSLSVPCRSVFSGVGHLGSRRQGLGKLLSRVGHLSFPAHFGKVGWMAWALHS